MSRNSLMVAVMKYAAIENIQISMSQCQRMVRKALRSMEREDIRTVIGWAETTDDYKSFSYSDRTGEAAVNNIMKELFRSARPSEIGVTQ